MISREPGAIPLGYHLALAAKAIHNEGEAASLRRSHDQHNTNEMSGSQLDLTLTLMSK